MPKGSTSMAPATPTTSAASPRVFVVCSSPCNPHDPPKHHDPSKRPGKGAPYLLAAASNGRRPPSLGTISPFAVGACVMHASPPEHRHSKDGGRQERWTHDWRW